MCSVLAKLTSKNQLTLPKSVTEAIGPVQYFEVQARAGQIVLTPVRIQRGDALRAKLAELALDEKTLEAAAAWASGEGAQKTGSRKKTAAAKASPAKKTSSAAAKKPAPRREAAASRAKNEGPVTKRATKVVSR